MIDIARETVLSLADAAAKLPRRRRGKKPHVSTLYRWAEHGIRGVKLETVQIGGTRCTSLEAMQRFTDRLSNQSATLKPPKFNEGDVEEQLAQRGYGSQQAEPAVGAKARRTAPATRSRCSALPSAKNQ